MGRASITSKLAVVVALVLSPFCLAQSSSEAKLPVSINEVMVALVNQAADPIWVADWKNPQSDRDWRNLEYLGYQLEIAGALLTMPGTGPMDKEWVSKSGWKGFAKALSEAGKAAKSAATQRNINQLHAAGNQIVDVCEGCHKEYKLALPTGGIFGELSPLPK